MEPAKFCVPALNVSAMRSFRSERFWKNKAIRKRGAVLSPSFFFSLFCFFGKAQNLLCLRHLFRNLVFGTIPNFDNPSYSQCVLHRCRDHDRISLADFVLTAVIACSHHAIDIDTTKLCYTRESRTASRGSGPGGNPSACQQSPPSYRAL